MVEVLCCLDIIATTDASILMQETVVVRVIALLLERIFGLVWVKETLIVCLYDSLVMRWVFGCWAV